MGSKMHVVADMEINKVLRAFSTRTEAIDYVRGLLKTNGNEYAQALSLGRQTEEGQFVEVVTGDELRVLVEEADAARDLVTASGSSQSGMS